MDKSVLIIGETGGFMVNAIINGLKKEGYEILPCEAKVNALSKIENLPKLAVLYLDSDITAQSDFLVFLRDTVVEKEIGLFVIGSIDDFEDIKGIFSADIPFDKLIRPLNVKDLAVKLDKAYETGSKAEERKKILVVDDDPTMLRMIKGLLSDKYHVFVVNSGMNAITFLATNKVDLILLDYEMPVISGAKVLEMIRSEVSTESIPVMFLTSKNDKESVMKVLALKPEKYLLKTMPPQDWIRDIDEFFEHH